MEVTVLQRLNWMIELFFSLLGLDPGSKYMGELVGHNVKGAGPGHTFPVYTLKPPEAIESPPAGPPDHQVESLTHTFIFIQLMFSIQMQF